MLEIRREGRCKKDRRGEEEMKKCNASESEREGIRGERVEENDKTYMQGMHLLHASLLRCVSCVASRAFHARALRVLHKHQQPTAGQPHKVSFFLLPLAISSPLLSPYHTHLNKQYSTSTPTYPHYYLL